MNVQIFDENNLNTLLFHLCSYLTQNRIATLIFALRLFLFTMISPLTPKFLIFPFDYSHTSVFSCGNSSLFSCCLQYCYNAATICVENCSLYLSFLVYRYSLYR